MRGLTFYSYVEKNLHDIIIHQERSVVPIQLMLYRCMIGVSMLLVSKIILFDFGIVPTMCYFLLLICRKKLSWHHHSPRRSFVPINKYKTKKRGWTRVLTKGKQFLLLISYSLCCLGTGTSIKCTGPKLIWWYKASCLPQAKKIRACQHIIA